MFAGNFAPRTWAFCEGQIQAISSNTALFSIIGTTYGGDGVSTFALPDLRGRAPIGAGSGPGLTPRVLGHKGGTPTNTMTVATMPSHEHAVMLSFNPTPDTPSPANAYLSGVSAGAVGSVTSTASAYNNDSGNPLAAASVTIANSGGNQAFNNMQPYMPMYYIICIYGIYPSRG